MKNILLILVGGTICTALNKDGNLSVNEQAGVLLKESFLNSDSPYAGSVNIEATENLYILSENMNINRWNQIIDVYRKYTLDKNYDGIIMAHGTDTLAYSAALFSMLLSDTKVPVFLVSANENLSSARSNGHANFALAVECICRGITPNVYVPYKNLSDGRMYLHLASRLRQCENYSEDFYSVGAFDVTAMTEENYGGYLAAVASAFPKDHRKTIVDMYGDWKLKDCVLYITPYVGINYDCYDYSRFAAVLHGTYHSGTAASGKSEGNKEYDNTSVLHMLDKCYGGDKKTEVYMAPSVLKSGTYETISIIGNHEVDGHRANYMYGCTMEMAYAKMVIAYSLFEDEKDRREFIDNEYNFEVIDKK